MRVLLGLLMVFVVDSIGVHAMENHTGVLRDQYGRAITGATVTVKNAGTATISTLYSDNGVTAKSNPFLTNALDGSYAFYAANGVYDVTFSYPGVTFDVTLTKRMAMFDVNDFPSGGTGIASSIVSSGTLPAEPCTAGAVHALSDIAGNATPYFCNDATWTQITLGTGSVPTLDQVFDAGKLIDSANSATNALKILDANGDGTAIYTDATDGPQIVCVENSVVNGCASYTRKLASGQALIIKNSSGTDISTLTESTGAYTNVKMDGEGSGNVITLTEEWWTDVAACQNATAQLVWNVPTTNAPAAACDTGTNTQKGYASFDATTDESFEMDWVLPTGFTGSIDVHFIWKAAATSGAVGWCAQLVRVADASTSDPAYPAQATGNCVSDAAKGTTLQENHATITGVTCTSCVARDHVYVRISRDANGGAVTDDMTGDARLMKVGRTWRVAH